MKEKELKKLSRLELLEILYEETKENEALRKKLDEALSVSRNNMEALNLTQKLRDTLKQAETISERLSRSCPDDKSKNQTTAQQSPADIQINQLNKGVILSDLKLYIRILKHYSENAEALKLLPENMQEEIKARIRGISDAKKQ